MICSFKGISINKAYICTCITIDQKYQYKLLMITMANGSGTLLKFAIVSILMIHPQCIWQSNCNSYFVICLNQKQIKLNQLLRDTSIYQ